MEFLMSHWWVLLLICVFEAKNWVMVEILGKRKEFGADKFLAIILSYVTGASTGFLLFLAFCEIPDRDSKPFTMFAGNYWWLWLTLLLLELKTLIAAGYSRDSKLGKPTNQFIALSTSVGQLAAVLLAIVVGAIFLRGLSG